MVKKVLIVGGGFTGLTAAYELSKDPGFSITLVEGGDQLGGLAGGFSLLGTSLEKTYHHLFLIDTAILALVEELGLSNSLVWHDSSVGIYRGGRIYPFVTPFDLLRFTPCSLLGRIRVGLVALNLKRTRDWRPFVAEPAHQWMAKACGGSAMESIWTPLLKGKFDRYYQSVSMAWLWARIHTRANSRKPGQSREQLGYFHGGFAVVVQRLESELRKRGVQIELNSTVQSFSGTERSAVINGRREPFDFCIFTGPSPAFARLLPVERRAEDSPALPQPGAETESRLNDYVRQLQSIEYLGAICLVFVSDQNIGEYYWLNVNEPGAPFLVFLNHTRLVDKSHYQGKHVYYIGTYVPTDHALFGMTDDALNELWWGYLKKMFPEFDRQRVSERHIFRLKAAQHIVDTAYQSKIPDYRTPLPGVFLANFSQIFPEDRGTNWAVSEGKKVAGMVREKAKESA